MQLVYSKVIVQCDCGQLIEVDGTNEPLGSIVLIMCPACLSTGSVSLVRESKPQPSFGDWLKSSITDPTTISREYLSPSDHVYTKYLQTSLARSTPTLEDFEAIRKAFSED